MTKKTFFLFSGSQNYVNQTARKKKIPVYFNWNFPAINTNFKILRELDRGEDDVKDSMV